MQYNKQIGPYPRERGSSFENKLFARASLPSKTAPLLWHIFHMHYAIHRLISATDLNHYAIVEFPI